MKIYEFEQGTPEWHEIRCGIPTASCFDQIVTTKGDPSKQRTKYMYKLAGERLAGKAEESYQNGPMLRGKELEAEARSLYQIIKDLPVKTVGFCLADGYGASPDSLVGENGGLEIKCPIMSTHVGYLLENRMPTDYFQQVQGNLLVTGREWWDFVSYYPAIRPLIVRIERDEVFIRALKAELTNFCQNLDEIVEKLKEKS
jgi:hypothetical protein